MSKYLLDASAVIALFNQEKGYEAVEEALTECAISTVNLSETVYKMIQLGWNENEFCRDISALDLEVIDFNLKQSRIAAHLKSKYKQLNLSLGDSCCLAAAIDSHLTVITADKIWAKIKDNIKIVVIR